MTPVVQAGPATPAPIPELQDDEWHDLVNGGLVNTDENGEARVKIREVEDCGLIYVFRTSELIAASCPKRAQVGGNVICLTGKIVVNNHCREAIIQTLSIEVVPQGTWLAIGYLPEQQVSLVMVFDGAAQVRPVLHMDGPILGDALAVDVGHFWFTSPGVQPDPIAGLSAREPYPFDRLPPLADELDLWPWWDWIKERANEDKVSFPEFPPTPTPTPTPTATPTVTPTATPTPCAPQPPFNWRQYVVGRGNTLSSLARRHGTTVQEIRRVNCLVGDAIQAGQWLWLPLLPTPTPTPCAIRPPSNWQQYVVGTGDTLTSLARRHDTTVWEIKRVNCLVGDAIQVGQWLWLPTLPCESCAPCEETHYVYVVRPGDTLAGIAARFGVSTSSIARANGIASPLRIYAGQRLVIPCPETETPTNTPTVTPTYTPTPTLTPTPTNTPTLTPTPTNTPVPASVTGTIWYDRDGDGAIDPYEQGLPNTTVTITNSQGFSQTVQTDADGVYSATVAPGRVTIDVDLEDCNPPYGCRVTTDNDPAIVDIDAGGSRREDFGIIYMGGDGAS